MDTLHNPDRFMTDFRQVLSQGRKRIGLLVGAGAPVSIKVDPATGKLKADGKPLIPAVAQLTPMVIGALDQPYKAAAEAVLASLEAEAKKLTPPQSVNIEMILSKIRLIERAIGQVEIFGLNSTGFAELGKNICAKIGALVGAPLPQERNAYTEFVSWISGTHRQHAIEIFTSNYDLLFETAFERARVPYFDGFSGGNSSFFDPVSVAGADLPSRWPRLWKLHGSLGWKMQNDNVVRGHGAEVTELIYPDHLKYDLTQKQPYSALFDRLKQFLLTPDTLLIATGFSFNDAHICAVLDEALAMNSNAAVFAFQFQNIDKEIAACDLASDRPNLSVYARDGAVIRGVAGKWGPGEMAGRQWQEIRKSFWGAGPDGSNGFLLGDFSLLSKFCALSQATDLKHPAQIMAEDLAAALAAASGSTELGPKVEGKAEGEGGVDV